jgi:hypothetical protein
VQYKFIVEYNGITYYASSVGAGITRTSITFRIDLSQPILQTYYGLNNYQYRLWYSNDSQVFSFLWNDVSGVSANNCLKVYKWVSGQQTQLALNCSTSASGQINTFVNVSAGGEYDADAYITLDDNSNVLIDHLSITYNIGALKTLGKQGGFLAFILLGSISLMFIGNPILMLIIFVSGTIIIGSLGFLPMSYGIGIMIVILALIVIYDLELKKKSRT